MWSNLIARAAGGGTAVTDIQEDGWDDDEEEEEDGDFGMENNDEEEEDDITDAGSSKVSLPPPPQPMMDPMMDQQNEDDYSDGGGGGAVGGMFMGRITRFLETVTKSEDAEDGTENQEMDQQHEDQYGDGWEDEDEVNFMDDDDDDDDNPNNMNNNDPSSEWEQSNPITITTTTSWPPSLIPGGELSDVGAAADPQVPAVVEHERGESPLDAMSEIAVATTSEQQQEAPGDDHNDDDEPPMLQDEHGADGNGWDDDDHDALLDDEQDIFTNDNDKEGNVNQTTPIILGEQQEQPRLKPPKEENLQEIMVLEEKEEESSNLPIATNETVPVSEPVYTAAEAATTTTTAGWATGVMSGLRAAVVAASPSAVAAAAADDTENGWEEDDEPLLDDEEEEQVEEIGASPEEEEETTVQPQGEPPVQTQGAAAAAEATTTAPEPSVVVPSEAREGRETLYNMVHEYAQALDDVLTEIQEIDSPAAATNNATKTTTTSDNPVHNLVPADEEGEDSTSNVEHFTSGLTAIVALEPLADLDVVDMEEEEEKQSVPQDVESASLRLPNSDSHNSTDNNSFFSTAQEEEVDEDEYANALQHEMDEVLDEIERQDQESPQQQNHTDEAPPSQGGQAQESLAIPPSDPAAPSEKDMEQVNHDDQAILTIQEDVTMMEQQQTQQQPDESREPVSSSDSTLPATIVDHTPVDQPDGSTTPDIALTESSLQPQVEFDDLTERQEPAPPPPVDGAPQDADSYDGDADVYENENEDAYGLVVDHTPRQQHAMNATMSMIVQAADLARDMVADEAMDETVFEDDDENAWNEEEDPLDAALAKDGVDKDGVAKIVDQPVQESGTSVPAAAPTMVDHTPALVSRQTTFTSVDPSVAALPSEGDTMLMEDLTMAGDMTDGGGVDGPFVEYGPMVDQLPTSATEKSLTILSTSQSLAVNAFALEEDFRQDDAMDESVVDSGTIDDAVAVDYYGDDATAAVTTSSKAADAADKDGELKDGWDNDGGEDDDVDDDDLTEPNSRRLPPLEPYESIPPTIRGPPAVASSHMVDHTPSELEPTESDRRRRGQRRSGTLSVVVQASEEDLVRDSGMGDPSDEDVYDDENEIAYVPVVDHTPDPETATSSAIVVNSQHNNMSNTVAAHATASVMDDCTLFGDSTIAGGTTLDDVGTIDGGGTIDGTIDGGGTVDVTIDDGIIDHSTEMVKEEDGERGENNANEGTMVDHTPSEMGSPPLASRFDPSVAVMASIDENDSDADGDFGYGPMVDHTPTTPAHARRSRSDSVIAQVNDTETAEDETLLGTVEGDTVEGDDGDTIDDEMPSALRSFHGDQFPGSNISSSNTNSSNNNNNNGSNDGNVVDRVPPRPESRVGDASTLVAAEESEVLSVVGDMEECAEFGLVVDQTPPARPLPPPGVPSGAGSTVVFAPPSVATDDLDPDETEAHGQGEEGWDHEDPIIEETTPNPQSGNDEEVVNEQLVDFLPSNPPALTETGEDVDDHGGEPSTAEASSEYAVGGAQSLLQPEDPKEDDFGPVVDQTPTPQASSAPRSVASVTSTVATLVTASEIARLEKEDAAEGVATTEEGEKEEASKVVVDHVPNSRGFRNLDSVATVGQSQFTEEDEEEETDSKFGPVVDHLPFLRTSSMAASRGGSTVDALGAVSEGDVDSAGVTDGWADDFDMDASAASDRTDRVSQAYSKGLLRRSSAGENSDRAGVSVRFDSTVRDRAAPTATSATSHSAASAATPGAASTESTVFYDAQMATATPGTMESNAGGEDDDSQYYDTELMDRRTGASFSEAETPPSTPHHRHSTGSTTAALSSSSPSSAPWLDLSALDSLVLTQQQKEQQPKPSTTKPSDSRCIVFKDGECPVIQKLLDLKKQEGALFGTIIAPDGSSVEVDFGQLLEDEMVKRRLLEQEANALRALSQENNAKVDELENASRMVLELQRERSEILAMNTSEVASLQAQVKEKDELIDGIRRRTTELETTIETIRNSNDKTTEELSASQSETQSLREQASDLREKLEQAKQDTENLASNELTRSQQEIVSLKQEVSLLRDELVMAHNNAGEAASAEISKLRSEKELTEATCREMGLEIEKLKNDLDTVTTQSSEQLAEAERSFQRESSTHAEVVASLKEQLAVVEQLKADHTELIANLRNEKEESVTICNDLRGQVEELQNNLRETQEAAAMSADQIRILQETKDKFEDERSTLVQQVADLTGELTSARKQQDDEASASAELVAKLRSDLEVSTVTCGDQNSQLEQLKRELSSTRDAATAKALADASVHQQKEEQLEAELSKMKQQIVSLSTEVEKEQDLCQRMDNEVQELSAQLSSSLESAANEKAAAVVQLQNKLEEAEKTSLLLKEELEMRLQESETSHSTKEQEYARDMAGVQSDLAQKIAECDEVRAELTAVCHELKSVRDSTSKEIADVESKLEDQLRVVETEREDLRKELQMLKENLQAAEQRYSESEKTVTELVSKKTTVEDQLATKEGELVQLRGQIEIGDVANRELRSELDGVRTEKEKLSTMLEVNENSSRLELEQRDSLLEEKLKEINELETSLRNKVADSNKLEADLSAENRSIAFESEKLASELASVKSECDSLRNQLSQSQTTAESLQRLIDEHGMEQDALESKREQEVAEVRANLDKVASDVLAKEQRIVTLTASILQLERANAGLTKQLTNKTEEVATIENAAEKARSSLQNEQKKSSQTLVELESLRTTFANVRQELGAVDAERLDLVGELGDLRNKHESLQAAGVIQEERAVALENELNEKLKEINELETSLRNKAADSNKLEADLSAENRSIAFESEKLASELASVKSECDSLRNQLSQSQTTAESLQRLIDEHGMEQDALESKREQEVAEVRAKLDKVASDVLAREQRIVTLTASILQLERANAGLTKQLTNKTEEVAAIENAAEKARSSLQNEQKKSSQTLVELESLRTTFDNVRQELRAVDAERSDLVGELGDLRNKHESLQAVGVIQEERAVALENELKETRSHFHVLETQSSNWKEAVERATAEKTTVESSLTLALAKSEDRLEKLELEKQGVIEKLQLECNRMRQQLQLSGDKIQSELDVARATIDQTRRERDVLVDENEELLVQLGLLKEGMDASAENFMRVELDLRRLESQTTEVAGRLNGFSIPDSKDPIENAVLAIKAMLSTTSELESQLQTAVTENGKLASDEIGSRSTVESLEARCRHLEQECSAKQAQIDRLLPVERNFEAMESERVELQARLEKLEAESDDRNHKATNDTDRMHSESGHRGPSTVVNGVGLNENLQVSALQEENRALQLRVVEADTALKRFQDQAREEQEGQRLLLEEQISALQKQLEVTTSSLQATQSALKAKEEEEMKNLASEIRNAASDNNVVSNGDVEDSKSQIVSLALALQKSESQRADAMDNLILERQAHADSLRNLGESVKRYFSRVS